ncbi:glycosyltransferase [Gammaproteobacteria bacterium]|nr:glycosyltransferase [Gammaproteobacteria bacterium]
MIKLKVVYITIEDISSGLFSSQVLAPLMKMAEIDSERAFEIIILNRPWKYLEHRRTLKTIRKSVLLKNISIRYIPFLPPLRNVTKSKFLSRSVTYFISFLLLILTDKKKTIYHSRSYWPCASGLLINLKPMIFEPRSLWNLENIAMGSIIRGTSAETYWNNLEKICANRSERIISINDPMANYFSDNYNSSSKNNVIPISFSDSNFSYSSIKRKEIRAKLFLNDKKVFVYSGSFGMTQIGIEFIIKIIGKLNESCKNAHFLFLTPHYEASSIKLITNKVGISSSDYTSIHPKFYEISDYLSASDYGYHSLPIQPDSFTRMGTKVVEYLAIGLPVIVNKHVGAAADILKNKNLGFIIDDDSNSEIINSNLNFVKAVDRTERINFAKEEFEISSIAKKYVTIYNEIDSTHSNNI